MVIRKTAAGRTANILIYLFVALFALFCLMPFVMIFMVSITDEVAIQMNGYALIPEKFSLEAYRFLLSGDDVGGASRILSAYKISTIVTLGGGLLSIFVTSMFAYVLSNKKLRYRNLLSFYMFFTMLFSGGLVPWYLVCTSLGLRNSIWGLILPITINAWNTFLLRNFFATVPDSLLESARIDGANEFTTYVRIAFPLCIPGIVTVGLFYVLGYWNDWWNAIMFISKQELYPLQYLLREIMGDITNTLPPGVQVDSVMRIPTEGVRMATTMLTIGPIILVYPFVQRFFVKGVMVGAVKG